MKRVVGLVLCLYILSLSVKAGEEVHDLIKEDCVEGDSSCVDECKGEPCYRNCQRSRCCLTNYQGGCCNQCRQRCINTCYRPDRCCKEERVTTTPKTVTASPTKIKTKTESSKVEDSANLTAINKNTADIKTNLLITNKIKNENAVNIPIEVNDRNVNDFVIELRPPTSRKKESTEIETEESEEEEDNCCNNNCCNGINNNCCHQNPCYNCQQPGCWQNCNYSPCRVIYFHGNPVTICPNEYATQQHLVGRKQWNGNGNTYPDKNSQVKTKGCNTCLYCDGKYQPNVCMKTPQCTDVCRVYLLDKKTVSPVKCTVSADGEYNCQRVY